MNRFTNVICVTLALFIFSVSQAATVDQTYIGNYVECNTAVANCDFVPEDYFELTMTFDDSLYGSVIGQSDLIGLEITHYTQASGTLFTDLLASGNLSNLSIELDGSGRAIDGGFTETRNPFGNIITVTVFDFGGLISPWGTNVNSLNTISFDGGTTSNYVGGECFEGYACNAAVVPVPAAAWLFLSALFGMISLKHKTQYPKFL